MPFIGRDGTTAFLPATVNTSSSLTVSGEGDLIVDTNTLFVDSSANKVGIGTVSPTSIFDVETGAGSSINFNSSGANAPTIDFMAGAARIESAAQILVGENNGGGDFLIKTKNTGGTLTTRVTINNAGLVKLPDNGKFVAGAGNDLQIYHNGTDTWIDNAQGDLYIRSDGAGGDDIIIRANDDVIIQAAQAEDAIIARGDGEVELYYNNSKKFETTTTGVSVTGNIDVSNHINLSGDLDMGDDDKLKLGAGDDLQIYHDATDSWIDNDEGDLYIRNTGDDIVIRAQDDVVIQVQGSEAALLAKGDGAVELYHNGQKRFETEANGAKVTGILDVTSDFKVGGASNILVGGTALPSLTGLLGGSLSGTLSSVTMAYLAAAPSSPVQGQFYFNSLSSKAQIYTGSSFVDLVPSGGGGGGGGGSSTDAQATFRKYTYSISSATSAISGAADGVTDAGAFVTGRKYQIKTVGNTDFTAVGSADNNVGTIFTATGAGSGTGDAYDVLVYVTGGSQNVEVYVNGVKSVEGASNDYVATSGTSVNFVANLASGDVVDVLVYELLTNDAFVLAAGGTFTGNVGINTTSIQNRLHIHSNANDQGILLSQAGSNYSGIIADADRTVADNYILNLQANWNGNGVARIAFETGDDLSNKDDGRIKFSTSSSGSSPVVRMHITPSGNVGIGQAENTNATARLQVKGEGALSGTHHKYMYATDCGILIRGNEAGIDLIGSDVGSHAASILLRNADAGFGFVNSATGDSLILKSFTTSADDFYIHGTGSQVSSLVDIVTFTKAGNIGIGTDNPGDKLSIYTAPNALVFGAKDTTRGNHIFQLLANNTAGDGELRLYKSSATGTHEKTVEIKSTGNSYFTGGSVGIGTDSPDQLFHIESSAATRAKISTTSASHFGVMYFGDEEKYIIGYRESHSSTPRHLSLKSTHSSGVISFFTGSGERLRIASDGKLSLTGSAANMEYLRMGGNNDRGLRFTSSSGSSSVGVVHTINAPGDGGAQGAIVLQTNSADRLRITSGGYVNIGGNYTQTDYTAQVTRIGGNTDVMQVKGSVGNSFIRFTDSNASSDYSLGADDAISNGFVLYDRNASAYRVVVTSAGDVGIGDNAPNNNYGTNLSVHSTATDGARLKLSDGTTGKGNLDGLDIISTGGVAYFINRENADMSFSTNGSERLRITSGGAKQVLNGNLNIQSTYIDFSGDQSSTPQTAVALYRPADGTFAISTQNTERLRIDSSGRIKIGPIADQASVTTHCPVYIDVHSDINSLDAGEGAANTGLVRIEETGSNANRYHGIEFRNRQQGDIRIMNLDVNTNNYGDLVIAMPDQVASAGIHQKVRFNSLKGSLQIAGKGGPTLSNSATEHVDVYIATKSQISAINTNAGAEVAGVIRFEDKGSNSNRYHGLELRNRNSGDIRIFNHDQGATNTADMVFGVDDGSTLIEALRIHHDGHISQGTVAPPSSAEFTIRGANPELSLYASANYSSFLMMGDTNDYADGYIEYDNYAPSKGFKFITDSGHRMGLDSSGTLTVGASNYSFGSVGARISQVSDSHFCRAGGNVIAIRRNSSDGQFIDFYRDGTHVGDIRVASGNVTLTGAHLSRWTQLPGGAERTEILRGSVLTNLDEMCEWSTEAQEAVLYTEEDDLPRGVSVGDVKTPALEANTEDNAQLNRMKISDVEGDPNVSGVFDAWDNDDKVHKNDFYCAMTGDLVIRIAQGVIVARGDLLMSAGDGTAKPQDDDIIRSKTIAKVTSTHVALTHPDGSYCVPCVLMAC